MFSKCLFYSRLFNVRRFSLCSSLLQRIYTSEEKTYILNKINSKELPSKGLSSNHISKIYQYVEKNRLVSLEELLSISGIGPKVLRKICDSILNVDSAPVEKPKNRRRSENVVTPSLCDLKNKELICITAIHINVNSISWALVNSVNKSLLEWDLKEYNQEKCGFYQFLLMSQEITPLIPRGNIYILEDQGIGRHHHSYNVNLLTAMVSSFIHATRCIEDSSLIAFLKPSVKNNIYNGSVGSERVSLQSHVLSMLEERSQTDCISFPRELKDKFFSMKSNAREELSQALLLATSFINVILNQRLSNSK